MALGSSQPPAQWLFGVYRPKLAADPSPPSHTEIKNELSYTVTPLCVLSDIRKNYFALHNVD
jgi:hypothetical protein